MVSTYPKFDTNLCPGNSWELSCIPSDTSSSSATSSSLAIVLAQKATWNSPGRLWQHQTGPMGLCQCVFPIPGIQTGSEHRVSRKGAISFSSLLFVVSGQEIVNNYQQSSCPQTLLDSPCLCQWMFRQLGHAPAPGSARNQAGERRSWIRRDHSP